MPSLDRARFIYWLAGRLLAGEWTATAVREALKKAAADRAMRWPKLAERVFAAFAAKPAFRELVDRLGRDPGLLRAMGRAGFPVSSGSLARLRLPPTMEEPPPGLRAVPIPPLATPTALAQWLAVDMAHLLWHADPTGRNRRHPPGPLRQYRYRWIPRRHGLPRLLEIPKAQLKRIQRKILAEILGVIPVHPAAHGFCAGRSIVTHAAPHCDKKAVLKMDLADFFASVTSARVFQIFRTLGYPPDSARLLMGLCTTSMPADVWDARPGARAGADFVARQLLVTRHLPQGAPTSPALANLAANRLDRRLAGLASAAGAVYSRYADDLAFSGDARVARSRKRIDALISVIAYEEGFAVNHRKTRLMRAGVRQRLAGVVVNVRPNIRRDEFDRLKAILTNCARHGPASQNRQGIADFRAHLAGKIAHVASIHPGRGQKLRRVFQRIVWPLG